ncbi:hypothetical protein NM688_g427 [Phlebia brevispora]|uniref:Uncharacterized protein n=1 Tax=Phlebia brevispora TaxID=194682 RepID=A0ACC1TER6_9APHY|nr:hypothetical protein NM688_g427 [Phlebia brevispora]
MRPLHSTLGLLAFALLLLSWTALASSSGYFGRSSGNSTRVRPRSLNFHENIDGHVSSYHATPRVTKYRRELARKYKEKREAARHPRRRRPVSPRPIEDGVPFRPPPVRSTPDHHQYRKAKRQFDLTGGIRSGLTSRQADEVCDDSTTVPPSFDGTCGEGNPCPNGACCSSTGFCGYGSDYCGTGCLSNCDAKAECGPNAAPGNESCPLSVCCSQFGFCGTTDEFCGTGCVGNCGQPVIPTGQNGPATSRVVGYYEGWASSRLCDAWYPENILAAGYTHLNYAFASVDPVSYQIVPASAEDVAQYSNFTNLKQINPNLKTYISVGGWSFNDPPTQNVFSDLAASSDNRLTFANSLVAFLVQYGFDGVDLDWEYPGACDRGGSPADIQNYPLLMQTIRTVFDASGHGFGLTFTAPSSFWYLQNFDLPALLDNADWINLMTYDLHGVWDAKDVYIGAIVQAHTNLTEIKESVQLFMRAEVPLERIVLGLGFYGRSFQLSDPTCTTPGCPFSGPAPAGPCTDSAGILSYSEIQNLITSTNSTPVYDGDAAVMYLVYGDDGTNWISYDDYMTFQDKVFFAKDAGFGGLMVWAVDLDTFAGDALQAVLGVPADSLQIPGAFDTNSQDAPKCMQMDCGQSCPSGYVQMTDVTDGQLANPKTGCSGGQGRPVCCPVDSVPSSCQWRGGASICDGVCQPGEITLATDSWGTGAKCSSGHKAFCCVSGLTAEQIAESTDCAWYVKSDCIGVTTLLLTTHAGTVRGISDTFDVSLTSSGRFEGKQSHNCNDNVCPVGTFTKATSYYGDTNLLHACLMQEKSYCCYPPDNMGLNAPFTVDDLFPDPPDDGDLQWDEQDEAMDENAPNGGQGPDNDAFGLIAMDGPSNLLSSVDPSSDWVITGCTDSAEYQVVTAFCSKLESDPSSGCGAVFEDGAENTVVKMPSTCGAGPYARLALLQVNNSLALSPSLSALKPAENPIYEMHFDYEFNRLSETRDATDGDVLVRVDATNLPGYWSEIDTADPSSPVKRGTLEERWFGGFSDWLARLNKVELESNSDLSISKSFTQNLFSASQSCASADGSTTFMASIDLTASGNAQFHLRYGFYLEGTLVSTSINQAYVYASSDASASAGIVLSGRASVQYSSGQVPIIPQISWPGLSFAGIVTIGPTFNIYALLEGSVAASGTFSFQTSYQFPSGRVAWGIFGDSGGAPDEGLSGQVTTIPSKFQVTPQYNIQLGGQLGIHVIPEADLGISVLGYGASAYVAADAALTLDFSVDLSEASITVDGTLDFRGGVYQMASQGTRTDILGPYHFYQNTWNIYQYTLPFGSTSGGEDFELPFGLTAAPASNYIPTYPVYNSFRKRDGLSGILGSMSCPSAANSSSADYSSELADDDTNPDPDDVASEMMRRSIALYSRELEDDYPDYGPDISEVMRRSLLSPLEDISIGAVLVSTGCSGLTITPPDYRSLWRAQYFDLANPFNEFDVSTFAWPNPQPWAAYNPNTGSPSRSKSLGYGIEHIYEAQLLTVFITASKILDGSRSLLTFLQDVIQSIVDYQSAGFGTFCAWLRAFVFNSNWIAGNPTTYANRLKYTLPSSSNVNVRSMPLLNQISNQAKAAFIVQGKRKFRNANTLQGKQPSTVVYLMRQAGMSIDYMNQRQNIRDFYGVSVQVENIWQQFFSDYNTWLANAGLQNLQITNIDATYRQWMTCLLSSRLQDNLAAFTTQANTFLTTAQQVLDAKIAAGGNTLQIQRPLLASCTN